MIYFCIPALNEERTVGVVLWKLRQIMTELQRDFQIIVVDDASNDATQEVLAPYSRVLPLTLIRNEKQLGYAASLEMAIREAVRRSPYPKRDALITLQADFTDDPDAVPALVKRIEAGADLVGSAPALDEAAPRGVRYGRRLFRWLVRGRDWAEVADPFYGPRAYRIMTIKRAIESRGNARLINWDGWAANAELLAQTAPHSRRNDVIETTVHYRRLQRPSRFSFRKMLPQIMGVRSGKAPRATPLPLPEATIVVPAAIAVELATSHKREQSRPRQQARREPRRPAPPARPARPTRGARPVPQEQPRAAAALEEQNDASAVQPTEQPREKRRRRPRRRSRKPSQRAETTNAVAAEVSTGEVAETGEAAAPIGDAPRKKSRRGRRGGRGRKRGPRPGDEGQNNDNQESAGEAPAS